MPFELALLELPLAHLALTGVGSIERFEAVIIVVVRVQSRSTHQACHRLIIIGFLFRLVVSLQPEGAGPLIQMLTQGYDARTREHAEDIALVFSEFCMRLDYGIYSYSF